MTKKKKDNTKKEETKPEIKLPQFQYTIFGNCMIYTDKGMCMWMSPTGMSLEENIKYLDYSKSLYEKQIEVNAKKAEEEIKPPAENKIKKFKQV